MTILRKYANYTALCSAIRQTQGVCIHIHIHSDTHADLSRFVHVRAHKQLWMRAPLCMCIQERIRGMMGKHKDSVPYLCMIPDVCSLCAADDETVMVAIRMCLRGDCRKNESTTVDAQKYAPFVVHILRACPYAGKRRQ